MDKMKEDEDRSPAIEEVLVASPTEASLRLQVTDLLLGGLRDVRMGRSTREQGDVLQQIEAALEAYRSYFYPPSTANEAVTVLQTVRWQSRN
jgi:hypothetical protein